MTAPTNDVAARPDRIEKSILLHAPLERVWRALSDSGEFGAWFGIRFEGPFVAGEIVRGTVVPTVVDAEIAAQQEAWAGTVFETRIVRVEPPRHLSFRWHPGKPDPDVPFDAQPSTLVAFDLEERPDGVLLRVVESGFAALPPELAAAAFRENEQGWAMQMRLVEGWLLGRRR